MSPRPEKHPDLTLLISTCIDEGNYFDTRHASERQSEHFISRLEVAYVLKHGRHEKLKDSFKSEFNAWNYAIRGKTVDKRDLRIVVSFDEATKMLIITAIELIGKGK